jgi:hypothetical protein
METLSSPSLALSLLGAAVSVFLGAQIRAVSMEKPMLAAQTDFLFQRIGQTREALSQAEDALQKREEQLRLYASAEVRYTALLTELLEIAKTDPDARAIAQKWKIQQAGSDKAADTAPTPPPADVPPPKGSKTPIQPKLKAPAQAP